MQWCDWLMKQSFFTSKLPRDLSRLCRSMWIKTTDQEHISKIIKSLFVFFRTSSDALYVRPYARSVKYCHSQRCFIMLVTAVYSTIVVFTRINHWYNEFYYNSCIQTCEWPGDNCIWISNVSIGLCALIIHEVDKYYTIYMYIYTLYINMFRYALIFVNLSINRLDTQASLI